MQIFIIFKIGLSSYCWTLRAGYVSWTPDPSLTLGLHVRPALSSASPSLCSLKTVLWWSPVHLLFSFVAVLSMPHENPPSTLRSWSFAPEVLQLRVTPERLPLGAVWCPQSSYSLYTALNKGPTSFFRTRVPSCPGPIYGKDSPFPEWIVLAALSQLTASRLSVLFCWSIRLSSCQDHTVL